MTSLTLTDFLLAPLWGCGQTMGKPLALPFAGHPNYRQEWRP